MKKGITADELRDKLEQNDREYHKAVAPVLKELTEAGFPVNDVGELRHKRFNFWDIVN